MPFSQIVKHQMKPECVYSNYNKTEHWAEQNANKNHFYLNHWIIHKPLEKKLEVIRAFKSPVDIIMVLVLVKEKRGI